MSGYVWRRNKPAQQRLYAETIEALRDVNPMYPTPRTVSDAVAVDVLVILRQLSLNLEIAQRSRRLAFDRHVCGACGALHAGPTCDVCRARMGRAA